MRVNLGQLQEIRRANADKSIAFRSGCFDLMHAGHIAALEFAKQQADLLVVGIRPDSFVAETKGPTRPIVDEISRLVVVDALKMVDFSFIMPHSNSADEYESSTLPVMQMLQPDVFVCAQIQGSEPQDIPLTKLGISVVFDVLPKLESTSAIEERIYRRYGASGETTA